jgi:hypothetical protein
MLSRRHIPDFKINWETSHIDKEEFLNYFNRIYPLQELPGLLQYVKRHPEFDQSLYESIHNQIKNTKEKFRENIESTSLTVQGNFHVKIDQRDVDDITYLFCERVLLWKEHNSFILPDINRIFDSVRKSTSAGGSEPHLRKRDKLDLIKIHLDELYSGTLDWSIFKCLPDLINLRNQIRLSGLKNRVIFMVEAIRQSLENVFRTSFCLTFLMNNESEICYGRTQAELSAVSLKSKGKYTLCLDYSSFDHSIPLDILVFAFDLMEKALKIDGHLLYSFRQLRNIALKSMMFHPTVGIISRSSGLSSGSSYTNVIGSIVNFIVTYMALLQYCRRHNINFWKSVIECRFSGDDGFITSDFEINGEEFIKIVLNRFGMRATIEHSSGASFTGGTVYFLGSKWIDGKPHRPAKRLLMQILFGSGNMPKMSDKIRFLSRGMDIFGNDCNAESNFLKCGINFKELPVELRLFHFYESFFSESSFLETQRSLNFESRGEWQNHYITEPNQLNNVWLKR